MHKDLLRFRLIYIGDNCRPLKKHLSLKSEGCKYYRQEKVQVKDHYKGFVKENFNALLPPAEDTKMSSKFRKVFYFKRKKVSFFFAF